MQIGDRFPTRKEAVSKILRHYIRSGKALIRPTSEPNRVNFRCALATCTFSLWLRLNAGIWVISTVEPHLDCRATTRQLIRSIRTDELAHFVKSIVYNNPSISVEALRQFLFEVLSIDVGSRKASRAKNQAAKVLYGNFESSFSYITSYLKKFRERNPGSVIDVSKESIQDMLPSTRINHFGI